jgi:hypothetical protein
MKIIVNKEEAKKRTEAIVNRIAADALKAADDGKITFLTSIVYDELNGIEFSELKDMLNSWSEGTVEFGHEFKLRDNYYHLKIVPQL